jgi:glutamate formiminotransferase / 5-formyltetrahydrofolate cyclo-ligase
MSKIIAVVPNISEGRNAEFIDQLTAKLTQVKDLAMLDVSRDSIRNRTIFSFTGTKEAIFVGGRLLYAESLAHINMLEHRGEYPRIGAVDVFPFVPLKDVAIEEAIAMSREFAEMVAKEFSLPVYLFSESAQYPTRRELDNIREGEFEGLERKLQDPRWKPDFGPDHFIPRSGATIIGARYPLISFTATLTTTDLEIAQAISRSVHYNEGGFSTSRPTSPPCPRITRRKSGSIFPITAKRPCIG